MLVSRETTEITGEQLADIFALIVSEFPHMTFDEAEAIIDNDYGFSEDIKNAWLDNRSERCNTHSVVSGSVPNEGVEFELTIDGDFTVPRALIEESDLNPKHWRHVGNVITGRNTGRFKLVRAGYRDNIRGVIAILNGYGRIPLSQWLQAFMNTFQLSDCLGPIGVADLCWLPEWALIIDRDNICYPFVTSKRLFYLRRSDLPTDASWRWLVQIDG